MTKLTQNQTRILLHAAGYIDGAVMPLPDDLPLTGGALSGTLGALRRKGLCAKADDGAWRITDAGRAAVGASADAGDDLPAPDAEPATPRQPQTKQMTLVALLRRPGGATIADIQAETGWQAHSVRGAISGVCKKKLGLQIEAAVEGERGRVYRILTAA